MTPFGPLLVTGWRSHVGKAVVRAGVRHGVGLTLLAENSAQAHDASATGCAVRIAAATDLVATRRAVRGHEAVIHITGIVNRERLGVELWRTAVMLAALDDGAALVMPAHSGLFGASARYARRPQAYDPPAFLGHSARLADLVCQSARAGRRAFGCHAALVLGNEGGRVLRDWLQTSLRRGYVGLTDSPGRWSGVLVDDWADLMLAIASKGAPGEWPLFAAGQKIAIADVARCMASACGLVTATPEAQLPAGPWSGLLAGDQIWPSDVETEVLGWRPQPFDVETVLQAACVAPLGPGNA